MFYGLSNYIKNLLPKRLFYRGLLIVAVPIVVLQITISLVFFDSLWIKTNAGMTRGLIAEIKTFIDAYDNDQQDKDYIINLFKSNLQIEIEHKDGKVIPGDVPERWLDISWEKEKNTFHKAQLTTVLSNEPGSLADVTKIISNMNGNISNIQVVKRDINFYKFLIDLEIQDLSH